ncbi:hypothetical protein BDD12DRAFT_94573 [Trichophaea hybrida]|nr:hypothetical protein BDD12DRAFT_94573 [Trichophaea hybrida]
MVTGRTDSHHVASKLASPTSKLMPKYSLRRRRKWKSKILLYKVQSERETQQVSQLYLCRCPVCSPEARVISDHIVHSPRAGELMSCRAASALCTLFAFLRNSISGKGTSHLQLQSQSFPSLQSHHSTLKNVASRGILSSLRRLCKAQSRAYTSTVREKETPLLTSLLLTMTSSSSNSKKMPVRNDTRHSRKEEDDYYAQDHVPTKDELEREIRYQRLHKAGLTPGLLRKKGAPEHEVSASYLYLRGIEPHRDGIKDEPINPAGEGKNSDEVEEEYFNYYVEEGVSNAPKPKPRKPKERYRSTYHPPGAVYKKSPPGGSPPAGYNSRLSNDEARHAAMATSFCRRDYCRWHNPYGASYSNAKRTDDRNPFFSGEGEPGEKAIEAEQSPLGSLDSAPPGPGAQEAYPQAVEVSNTSQDRPKVQILSKPRPKDAVTGCLEPENSLAAAKVNPKPAGNDSTTLKPAIPSPPTIETRVVAVEPKTKVDTAVTKTKVDKPQMLSKPQSKDAITGSLESKKSHAAAKANPKPAGNDTATLKPAIPSPPTTKITVETKAKADTAMTKTKAGTPVTKTKTDTPVTKTKADTVEPKTKVDTAMTKANIPVTKTNVDRVEPKTKVKTAGDAPHPKSKSKLEDTGNVAPSPARRSP